MRNGFPAGESLRNRFRQAAACGIVSAGQQYMKPSLPGSGMRNRSRRFKRKGIIMKRIKSFSINHNVLVPGIYTSRVDGDAVTYDVRMKKPNAGDYLANGALHTIEHLFATYARNSEYSDSVIYVGPMGCRTGFYLVVRDSVSPEQAIDLVKRSMKYIADFEGEIPGAKPEECGNYREHDLPGAKREAAAMYEVVKNWTPAQLVYPE